MLLAGILLAVVVVVVVTAIATTQVHTRGAPRSTTTTEPARLLADGPDALPRGVVGPRPVAGWSDPAGHFTAAGDRGARPRGHAVELTATTGRGDLPATPRHHERALAGFARGPSRGLV